MSDQAKRDQPVLSNFDRKANPPASSTSAQRPMVKQYGGSFLDLLAQLFLGDNDPLVDALGVIAAVELFGAESLEFARDVLIVTMAGGIPAAAL